MKKLTSFYLVILLVLFSGTLVAQVSVGGYNVYYGTLHNHCNVSDGTGTPSDAYNYAKNTSHLDFFSLADHSGAISTDEWTSIKNAANTYNQDGVFTAFWGFEWTSSSVYGHVAVINSQDYCTTSAPTATFSDLCTWLDSRECIAFFNHPGRENDSPAFTEFNHFTTTPSNKFVGMELWNKTDLFAYYYYNDGYFANDGNKGYYDEALTRSWNIGASGSEDHHGGTWGSLNYKMAVLANANTRTDLYAAFQARRFYSTLDKNIGLSFKINGGEMGSTVEPGSYSMQIIAVDGDGELFSTIKLVKNGSVVNTWNPNSTNPDITQTLDCTNSDYFYVIVTEADGNEAISSPIWCAGANEPPAIAMTNPANNATFNEPAIVSIAASASDNDGTISKVEFYQGAVKIGEDLDSPYTFDWSGVLDGIYLLTAVATDNQGAQGTSSPITINVTAQGYALVSGIIATGNDDVEEYAAGIMNFTSTDMELVYDSPTTGNQTVGLRFLNPGIPGNSIINSAFIQFTVDEATSGTCNVSIKGEDSDNSPAFTAAAFNVSARPLTSATVDWIPAAWPLVGEAGLNQRTPDLGNIIQEIVDRPGYNSNSALSMIITGTGTRTAKAFEGSPAEAAKLVVIYAHAPVADFTANQTEIQQGGTVDFTDQSTLEPTNWSWSFPGGTPGTSNMQNPSVVYNTAGVYSVTLTASNSAGSNTITAVNYITVNEPGYCSSQSTNFSAEYISKFTLGTFVNTSSGSYYSDFTSQTIALQANKKYTVKVTPTFVGGKKMEYFKVWIDYNHDFDFDDAGENVMTGSKNAEISKVFTTPSNVTGTTRLRVAMKRVSYSGTCETFTYGEVEDYTVNFGSKSGEILAEEGAIDKTTDNAVKIYPNPATGLLYIEKSRGENCVMEVYSLTGDLVMKSLLTSDVTRIDISTMNPGLYFVRCSDIQGVITRKLVIQ